MKNKHQEKYSKTKKGKKALSRAQKKYDEENLTNRRAQKKEYMRRKRAEDPNYCKWKQCKYILMKRKHYDILPEDLSGDDYTVWVW